MKSSKLWYLMTLVVLAMLSLAGCGGSNNSTVKQTEKGYTVTVDGTVAKVAAKSAALSPYSTIAASTVYVIDAQAGTVLTSGSIAADGSFKGITFTMPSAKSVLVFKAVVASGTVRTIVPVDLSNPPATVGASNAISINIDQNTENIAKNVSQFLGLTGIIGDGGQTLDGAAKTYADAATLVADNGGQTLAYTGNSLTLTGKVKQSLLPAVQASSLSVEALNSMILDGKVVSAFIPGNNPIVNFQVTNKATGKGIAGLRSFSLHVAQLQPETEGSNSYWLSYIIEAAGAARDRAGLPGSDPTGYTVVDNGDGSYVVTFKTNVKAPNKATRSLIDAVYDASLVHRVAIAVTSVAVPGGYAGPIDPATGAAAPSFGLPGVVNLVYDFTPATGAMLADATGKQKFARDIVKMDACNECHYKFTMPGHHFGSRSDTKLCVMCHNAQNVRNDVSPTLPSAEFTPFIHKIHMGEELPTPQTIAGLDVSEIRYPQNIRNCTKCHKGADVDNWNSKPSIKACGSCHNKIDFATGKGTTNDGRTVGHIGGAKTDNKTCVLCHDGATVKGYHQLTDVTANNPTIPAGLASFSYVIKSVAVNASKQPEITFQILQDGVAIKAFNAYASGAVPLTGFSGGPSFYVAYAVPQDGITAPADFNVSASASLSNLWDTSAAKSQGTLAVVDAATGTFKATLKNTSPAAAVVGSATKQGVPEQPAYPITIPTNAKLLTASMIGNFTQTTVTPNVVRYTQQVTKAASATDSRRPIVSTALCNKCHEQLGITPSFHSGARNDATGCAICHNPNKTSSGWSAGSSNFIHAIHGAAKRTTPFNWHFDQSYPGVEYPGILRNCEQCHLAGTYDFSATASAAALPNLLPITVATAGSYVTNLTTATYPKATLPAQDTYYAIGDVRPANTTGSTAFVLDTSSSPYVSAVNYGPGFAFLQGANTTYPASANNLVNSPISSACYSCHDTAAAKAHMVQNGGSIYEARSTALGKTEACLVCHGKPVQLNQSADAYTLTTVPTIKAVHRWW